MQVLQPQTRLDDPGVGLRNNGRRVLTYADLHTIGGPIDPRAAARDIELHLTGHMQRFIWSFDGEKFSASEPLRFTYGERLRMVLVNDTMMNHPIHLHGMWSELQAENGEFPGAQAHRSPCNPRSASATWSLPMRSGAGLTIAICSTTWRPACSARSWWSARARTARDEAAAGAQ